jgi:hypothetical protein
VKEQDSSREERRSGGKLQGEHDGFQQGDRPDQDQCRAWEDSPASAVVLTRCYAPPPNSSDPRDWETSVVGYVLLVMVCAMRCDAPSYDAMQMRCDCVDR